MMGKVARIFLGIAFFSCLLAGAIGATAVAAVRVGPENAVTELRKAIEDRDMARLETVLDLDAFVHSAVEKAMTDERLLAEVAKDPALSVMLAIGSASGANEALRSLLASEVRDFVRYGVTSGAFAGSPDPSVPAYSGLFREAFRGGARNRVQFSDPRLVSRDGDRAVVATVLTYGNKGKTYPLELMAVNNGNTWRITEAVNIDQLVTLALEKRG